MIKWWAILLVIIATIIGSAGPILFKKAGKKSLIKFYKNKDLIMGIYMYGMSTILFIPALKGGEVSVLYPLAAISHIWVSLLSVKYLQEKMNVYKWIGILMIIIGVAFIGLGS